MGLRIFMNRVLWRMFQPKREEVTGGWRKLHKKELHNLYSYSPNIIKDDQIKADRMDRMYTTQGRDEKYK
jgi:hypothetical protein